MPLPPLPPRLPAPAAPGSSTDPASPPLPATSGATTSPTAYAPGPVWATSAAGRSTTSKVEPSGSSSDSIACSSSTRSSAPECCSITCAGRPAASVAARSTSLSSTFASVRHLATRPSVPFSMPTIGLIANAVDSTAWPVEMRPPRRSGSSLGTYSHRRLRSSTSSATATHSSKLPPSAAFSAAAIAAAPIPAPTDDESTTCTLSSTAAAVTAFDHVADNPLPRCSATTPASAPRSSARAYAAHSGSGPIADVVCSPSTSSSPSATTVMPCRLATSGATHADSSTTICTRPR